MIEYWKTEVPFIDGHDLITAALKFSLVKPLPKVFTYSDFKNKDTNGLNNFLVAADCAICRDADELKLRVNCLYKHLHDAIAL